MDALKKLFINHGEKILLVVIGGLCLWSMSSHLLRPKDQLLLPGGKTTEIKQDEIRARLKKVDELFKSKDSKRAKPEADRVSLRFAREINAGTASGKDMDLEWGAYCRPAPIGIPQAFREAYNPEEPEVANIPAEFRTRIGNAEDVQVRAAVGKILITARDSRHLNFPLQGSRQMLVYRKAIGSAKDDLAPEIRAVLKSAPRSQTLDGESAAAGSETPATRTPAATAATSLWGNATAGAAARRTENRTAAAPDYTREQYLVDCNRKDLQADSDLGVITGNNDGLLLESGWELVTDGMFVVKKGDLSEDDISAIFSKGITPDLVVMSAEQQAEFAKEQKAKDAAKADKNAAAAPRKDLLSGMESAGNRARPRVMAIKPAKSAAVEETQEETRNQYVFLDENVKENMIYRYAVLAAAKPRMPEEKDVKDLAKWDIYCELVGVDKVGCFAPPQRVLRGVVFAEADAAAADAENTMTLLPELNLKRERGVLGPHLMKFITPAYDPSGETPAAATPAAAPKGAAPEVAGAARPRANNQENGPRAKSLRDDNRRLSPLGWAYKNKETCFADFVCSDLVLTPQKYDFNLVNAMVSGGQSNARIEVFKIEENGETYSAAFNVKAPELPRQVKWSDFLVKKEDGKIKQPVEFLPLMQVYNAADLAKVKPLAIGGMQKGRLVTAEAAKEAAMEIVRAASEPRQNAAAGKRPAPGMPAMPAAPMNFGAAPVKTAAAAPEAVKSKKDIDFNSNWGVLDIRPYKIRQDLYRKNKDGEFVFSNSRLMPANLYSVVIAEISAKAGEERRVRRLLKPLPVKPDTDTSRYVYRYVLEPELETQLQKREEKNKAAAESGKGAPAAAPGGK